MLTIQQSNRFKCFCAENFIVFTMFFPAPIKMADAQCLTDGAWALTLGKTIALLLQMFLTKLCLFFVLCIKPRASYLVGINQGS